MTGETPSVLVLLAARNGDAWIHAQLESILAQRHVSAQVLVSDDCSTDNTAQIVQQTDSSGRIRLLRRSSPSGSAARNFFSLIRDAQATGFDFIAFADQDDAWNEDKLDRACRALRASNASGDLAGYSSAVIAEWPDGGRRILRQKARQTRGDFLFEGAGQGCTFVMSAAFFARLHAFVTENFQLIQTVHYHDWAVYALVRTWKLRWIFDPAPSMHYRQHAANDTGARSSAAGIRKRLTLIRQGWYREQLLRIAVLCKTAAPANSAVGEWHSILVMRPGLGKRLRAAAFAVSSSRRKITDRAIIVIAALAGWI